MPHFGTAFSVLLVLLASASLGAGAAETAKPTVPPVPDDLERLIQKLTDGSVAKSTVPASPDCGTELSWKQPWEKEGWSKIMRQKISWKEFLEPSMDCRKFTHEFVPTAVISRKAGWTETMIREHFQNTAWIYSQCGIRMGSPTFYWADETPLGSVFRGGAAQRLSDRTPLDQKPIVYFLGVPGTYYDSFQKKDLEMTYAVAEISVRKLSPEQQKILQDRAFIGMDVQSSEYKSARNKKGRYDPVAHELAHLLGNCDHVSGPTPNLLQDYQYLVSHHLTPAQCEQFRRSPLVKPLNPEARCL